MHASSSNIARTSNASFRSLPDDQHFAILDVKVIYDPNDEINRRKNPIDCWYFFNIFFHRQTIVDACATRLPREGRQTLEKITYFGVFSSAPCADCMTVPCFVQLSPDVKEVGRSMIAYSVLCVWTVVYTCAIESSVAR